MSQKPEDGEWRGFYMEHASKYFFTLTLTFFDGGNFLGFCEDDEDYCGKIADIKGRWSETEIEGRKVKLAFNKYYRGGHVVAYVGYVSEKGFVKGTYYYDDPRHYFEMRKVRLRDATQEDDDADDNNQMKLFSNITQLYTNGLFFDFSIICSDGKILSCHKMMLAAQSRYFQGFFRTENRNEVSLDFLSEFLEPCIRFLYTAQIEIDGDNIQNILEVVNYLEITTLLKACGKFLTVNMYIENINECCKIAQTLGLPSLLEKAEEILKDVDLQTMIKLANTLSKEHLKKLLKSDDFILRSKESGNIISGAHRESMIQSVIDAHLKNNADTDQQYFQGCVRSQEEFQEKLRRFQGEEIVVYNQRNNSVIPQSSYRDSFDNQEKFDLSCEDCDVNICKIVLYALGRVLKGIDVHFSDGSEQTVMTEVGRYDKTHFIDLGREKIRRILYVQGEYNTDSLEYFGNLEFVLSDGETKMFDNIGSARLLDSDSKGILSKLPKMHHSTDIRLIGITGSILQSQDCGDSIISNIAFKYVYNFPR